MVIFGDFDVDIKEVVLVHRCVYENRFKYNDYRLRRGICGFVFCVEGVGEFRFDGEKEPFVLKPGQLIFLPANSAYTVCAPQGERFRHITVNFHVTEVTYEKGSFIAGIFEGGKVYASSLNAASGFRNILDRLLSVWHTKNYGFAVLAKSMVYELTYQYFSDVGQSHAMTESYRRLLPAKMVLDERFAEDISIKELSDLCGFSETHFRRLFTATFGISPLSYRIGKRIQAAKDLLLTGDYPVSVVAETVGFDDANYFSRIFRKQTGMSPGSFCKGTVDGYDAEKELCMKKMEI